MELMNSNAIRLMKLLDGIDKAKSLDSIFGGIYAWSCAWETLTDFETENAVRLVSRGARSSELTEDGRKLLFVLENLYKHCKSIYIELEASGIFRLRTDANI